MCMWIQTWTQSTQYCKNLNSTTKCHAECINRNIMGIFLAHTDISLHLGIHRSGRVWSTANKTGNDQTSQKPILWEKTTRNAENIWVILASESSSKIVVEMFSIFLIDTVHIWLITTTCQFNFVEETYEVDPFQNFFFKILSNL